MNWHEKCPKRCKLRKKCAFWGKTPEQYVEFLLTEKPLWRNRGSFSVSTNGLVACIRGKGISPIGIKTGDRLMDVLIPDLNRKTISVSTSDVTRTSYFQLENEDPEIQRIYIGKMTRWDVPRLVAYWYELAKDYGHELTSLRSSRQIHHFDECRLNNRVTNLHPLSRLAHSFVHKKKGIPLKTMIDYLRASDIRMERLLCRIEDYIKFHDMEAKT